MPVTHEPVQWEEPSDFQMRLWEEKHLEEEAPGKKTSKWETAHVTISRQFGARGFAIGQLLAQKLGWELYGSNIIEHIAKKAKLREKVISEFDERKHSSKLTQLLFSPGSYSSDKYYRHLVQVILSISRKGKAVIIGRGANFVTDKANGLHVRVIGNLHERARRYAEKEGIPFKEALKKVEAVDRQRAEFVRTYYHADISDPQNYDLVINVEYLNNEQITDIIIAALEVRLGEPRPKD
ncbi:MAG: cytidylate kinase-like family protein [candidate division KSB1 bacterium]|nr:cytidylate kinase-like family protein [candidate division KSB1 bacterium]